MTLTSTLTRRLQDRASSVTQPTPTIEITEELADSIRHERREILEIRPPKDSAGLTAGTDLVSALYHDPSILGETHTFSFTPISHGGRISLYASAPGGRARDIRDAVTNIYPGASIRVVDDTGIPLTPGHFAAGSKIHTAKQCFYPLRTSQSSDPLQTDPHTALLPQLVGGDEETACIQAVFRPVKPSWYSGGLLTTSGESVEEGLNHGKSVGLINPRTRTPDSSSRAASDVSRQHGRDAFDVSLRALAVAPTRAEASQRLRDIESNLNSVHNADTGQKLVPSHKSRTDLRALVQSVAGRWPDARPRPWTALAGHANALTDEELGDFLVHLPTAGDLNAPVEWSEQTEGERIPSDSF